MWHRPSSHGREWAAKSAATLARRLRRQRHAEFGHSRASALAQRARTFRASLADHWGLCDALGAHVPVHGEAVAAAAVVGLLTPSACGAHREAAEAGNWARHAPPPAAQPRLRPRPEGAVSSHLLETFRESLYCGAPPAPAVVGTASAVFETTAAAPEASGSGVPGGTACVAYDPSDMLFMLEEADIDVAVTGAAGRAAEDATAVLRSSLGRLGDLAAKYKALAATVSGLVDTALGTEPSGDPWSALQTPGRGDPSLLADGSVLCLTAEQLATLRWHQDLDAVRDLLEEHGDTAEAVVRRASTVNGLHLKGRGHLSRELLVEALHVWDHRFDMAGSSSSSYCSSDGYPVFAGEPL